MNLNVSWYLPRRKYWRRKHGPLSEVVKWLPRDSKALSSVPGSPGVPEPFCVLENRKTVDLLEARFSGGARQVNYPPPIEKS